jgi:hypothetical protein
MFENDIQPTDYSNETQLLQGDRTPLGLPQFWTLACRANLRAGRLPTATLCLQHAEEAVAAQAKKGKKRATGTTLCVRDVLLTKGLLLVAREADAEAVAVFRELLEFDTGNLIAVGYLRLLEQSNTMT